MEISDITTIAQLTPIECIDQNNCYYNNWLVSIQQNPQKILTATEEKKLINSHILLKRTHKNLVSTKQARGTEHVFTINNLHVYDCNTLLQTLLVPDCSFDVLDATYNHLQELAIPIIRHIFAPDALLKNNLKDNNQKPATVLSEYLQQKQQTIQFDNLYHSIYYAITNNYIDILNILLDLEEVPNIGFCHHIKCWNTNHSCIKEEEIVQSITNFLEKNSTNPNLQIEIFLKLFLTTEYLDMENTMSSVVTALVANEKHKYLVDSIREILSILLLNKKAVEKITTEQSSLENLTFSAVAKQINANCKITDLIGENFLKFQEKIFLTRRMLKNIRIHYFNSKLQVKITDKEFNQELFNTRTKLLNKLIERSIMIGLMNNLQQEINQIKIEI